MRSCGGYYPLCYLNWFMRCDGRVWTGIIGTVGQAYYLTLADTAPSNNWIKLFVFVMTDSHKGILQP